MMTVLILFVPSKMPVFWDEEEIRLDSRERSFFTFGRDRDSDLVFDNEDARTVSRRHCVLEYSAPTECWMLTDLNSTCGTWLNGFRLPPRDPTPLNEQDRFSLGTLPLDFVVLEVPNDTVEEELEATLASTTPLTTQGQGQQQGRQNGRGNTYADAAVTLAQWFVSGETTAGKIERFVIAIALVAVVVIVVNWLR